MTSETANTTSPPHDQHLFVSGNYSPVAAAAESLVNDLKNTAAACPAEKISAVKKGIVTICGTAYSFTLTSAITFEQFCPQGSNFNFRMMHIDFSFFYDEHTKPYRLYGKRMPHEILSDFQRYGTGNMAQDFASAHAILEQYRNDLTENLLAAAPKLLQYQLKPSKNIEIHQKETLPMAARTDRGGKS